MCARLRRCGKGAPGPLYAPRQLFLGFRAAQRTAATFKSTGCARKKVEIYMTAWLRAWILQQRLW